ncbi:DUF58 domain-containing protein [bacterium]|nr:MAG: DUF58 domain-containing protein [bacterium]
MEQARALSDHLRRRLLRLRARGPAGEGRPLLRGDGLEFAELRAYAEGDDPRRIDWAATARTGVLQMREMLEESGLALACALDAGPRMALGRRRSLRDAAFDLVALWLGAARGRDQLWLFANGAPVPLGGLRGERAATLAWKCAAPGANGCAIDAAALAYLDRTLPAGAALLLVGEIYTLEELLGDRHLARLPQRRWCAAMVAADPWREGIPLRGAVRLRDAADGSVRTLWIDEAAARRHAQACAQREAALLERLTGLGWRARLFDETTRAADLLDVC